MLGVSIDPKNPDSLVESYIVSCFGRQGASLADGSLSLPFFRNNPQFQFTYPSSKPHLTIQHQLGLGNEPVDVAKSVPVKTKVRTDCMRRSNTWFYPDCLQWPRRTKSRLQLQTRSAR